MAKIVLSPSTQTWNKYAGGLGDEHQHMRDIALMTAPILEAAGHTVFICDGINASANVIQSNMQNPDCHVSLHTNAGGGRGTEIWYYTGSAKGKELAMIEYKYIAPVSSSPDRGVKASAQYIELSKTRATAIIIEYDFHDEVNKALEIIQKKAEYAKATAQGLIEKYGVVDKPAPVPVPVPTPKPPAPVQIPPTIKRGNIGSVVRKLQTILNQKRRFGDRALAIDGDFGPRTEKAVLTFQKRNGLFVDGIVGPKTWRRLLQ